MQLWGRWLNNRNIDFKIWSTICWQSKRYSSLRGQNKLEVKQDNAIFSNKFMRRLLFGEETLEIKWLIWKKSIFQSLDKFWLDFFLSRERHFSKNNLTISWHLCKGESTRFYWNMSFR
jgi:hypothetical protein